MIKEKRLPPCTSRPPILTPIPGLDRVKERLRLHAHITTNTGKLPLLLLSQVRRRIAEVLDVEVLAHAERHAQSASLHMAQVPTLHLVTHVIPKELVIRIRFFDGSLIRQIQSSTMVGLELVQASKGDDVREVSVPVPAAALADQRWVCSRGNADEGCHGVAYLRGAAEEAGAREFGGLAEGGCVPVTGAGLPIAVVAGGGADQALFEVR